MCKGKRKAVSKFTAFLLTVMMAVTFIPTFAFGAETDVSGDQAIPSDQEEIATDSEADVDSDIQTDSQTEQKQPPALIPESTEHTDTSMPAG